MSSNRLFSSKALIITGPTATGKTALAFKIAKLYQNVVLINADSRQVYKGLDVMPGKDLDPVISLKGIDLVDPYTTFSLAQYYQYVENLISSANQSTLVIIVGGSGQYIECLFSPPYTLFAPQNLDLRKKYASASALELGLALKTKDPKKYASLNPSDQANPRRLIRALEVINTTYPIAKPLFDTKQSLFIGLSAHKELLKLKIQKRVASRFSNPDFYPECERFTGDKRFSSNLNSATILGYKEFLQYKQDGSMTNFKNSLILHETQYAKRQLTFLKRFSSLNWFDISKPNYQVSIEELIKNWYAINYGSQSSN